MKKLTKKQHRGIIRDLINENQSVQNLRYIQRVAEIFEEWDNLYDDIYYLMNKLDDTQLRHVYFFIRGMLGLK